MAGYASFDVAIVGGGACGLSTLVQLIEKTSAHIRVAIIEKCGTVGPGLAYSDACAGTRINKNPSCMGLSAGNQDDFVDWLQRNPSDAACGTEYPFRSYYGMYLRSEMARITILAREKGIILRVYKTEVTDIEPDGTGWIVHTSGSESVRARKAVLALGNYSRQLNKHLTGKPLYFGRAWPNSQLHQIPKTASVAILGSSLTAIDEALFLARNGYTGQIFLLSRSGQLPKVQGGPKRYERVFTVYNLARELERSSDLAVFKVARHFHDEIKAVSASDGIMCTSNESSSVDDQSSPAAQFRRDVETARRDENFTYRVLSEIRPVNERYWNCLSGVTKQTLLKEYGNTWSRIRSPMPLQTGEELLRLLERGQLRVLRIDSSAPISHSDATFHIPVKSSEGSIHVDSLIEATGMEFDITKIETPLVRSLLSRQLIVPHAAGGIDVDFRTMQVRENLYCLGSLTRGVHFLTTTLDRNVTRAEWLVDDILGLPQREFLHVALFVGRDVFSQIMVSRLVPFLLAKGLMPFIYVSSPHRTKVASLEEQELEFFETSLLQETVVPYLGSEVSDSGPCLTLRQLRQKFGVLVEDVPCFDDPECISSLASNYIDTGYALRCTQPFGSAVVDFFRSRQGLFSLHADSPPPETKLDPEFSLREVQQPRQAAARMPISAIGYSKAMLHGVEDMWPEVPRMILEHSDQIARGLKPAVQTDREPMQDSCADSMDSHSAALEICTLRSVDKEGIKKILVEAFAPAGRPQKLEQALEDAIRIYQDRAVAQSMYEILKLGYDVKKQEAEVAIEEIVLTDDETWSGGSTAASSIYSY